MDLLFFNNEVQSLISLHILHSHLFPIILLYFIFFLLNLNHLINTSPIDSIRHFLLEFLLLFFIYLVIIKIPELFLFQLFLLNLGLFLSQLFLGVVKGHEVPHAVLVGQAASRGLGRKRLWRKHSGGLRGLKALINFRGLKALINFRGLLAKDSNDFTLSFLEVKALINSFQ